MNYADMAIEILQKTNDGNDLHPQDLGLVQFIVNESVWGVAEQDECAFSDLYARVTAGYKKPWFHGIENLTIDHVGFVYWKDVIVEHYKLNNFAFTEDGKVEAEELARRCRAVEDRGDKVSWNSVIWDWEESDQL